MGTGSGSAFSGNITHEIQGILDEVDHDEDGYIDREQLVDFLSEWGLHEKYTDSDIDVIFKMLIVDNEEDDGDDDELNEADADVETEGKASCKLLMEKLEAVDRDHP